MRVGIEASNIRAGGGLTHIVELLNHANPNTEGIEKVVIWSGKKTLNAISDQTWLIKKTHHLLDKSIFHRLFWIHFLSKKEFTKHCDVLFTPGGLYSGNFKPYISMSQNMLVFEQKERARFGFSLTRLRLKLLSFAQAKSFKKATGVVFISYYAQKFIQKLLHKKFNSVVIYHGISDRFRSAPKKVNINIQFGSERPLNLLYVSIINEYKHQNILAKAVNELCEEGYFITLDLVGAYYPKSLEKLTPHLSENVKFFGKIDFEKIHSIYKKADAFVFSSTCENMPNILVEAMSAGLPIISSNYGPMPEILKENGLYIDPLNSDSIKNAILKIYNNPLLINDLSEKAHLHAQQYNWEKCAKETFRFLAQFK